MRVWLCDALPVLQTTTPRLRGHATRQQTCKAYESRHAVASYFWEARLALVTARGPIRCAGAALRARVGCKDAQVHMCAGSSAARLRGKAGRVQWCVGVSLGQAGEVFRNSEVFNNPIAGMLVGVLVTVLV